MLESQVKKSTAAKRAVMTAMVAAVAILAMPGLAMADEDEFLTQNEVLTYRVAYGPSHLADLQMSLRCSQSGPMEATLVAESQGMADRVHPFRVRLDTRTDLDRQAQGWAQTWIREKGSVRRYRSRFDASPQVATEAHIGRRQERQIVELPQAGHDLLSWLMVLRREVAADGELTGRRRYALWDGWKLVWLDVIADDVETRRNDAGEFSAQAFRLRRTELHHDGEQRFEARQGSEELGTVYIELSPRALPVAMAFKAPIGRVRINLQSFERDPC